ncbi:MAG: ATP synthase F0 subunit B [Gemmatimonadetes bacterium]|nr:ATP synthase F0 subunit B [Gemmatimonadota bacterium]|tara:strand:- start:331 stop:828 length:498 start_codon:yes stop_codon:yes gene_type:complete
MLLDVEPGLIFWTIVTFVLLLIVLRSVAWGPILGALDEREKRISDALEEADRARQEGEKQNEENKAALEAAQADARQAISEGRDLAERVAQEVRERAEGEASQMLEQARRTIQQERDQAVQELRNQVADLAILAARNILEDQLDENRGRQIVDDTISRLPDGPAN